MFSVVNLLSAECASDFVTPLLGVRSVVCCVTLLCALRLAGDEEEDHNEAPSAGEDWGFGADAGWMAGDPFSEAICRSRHAP
jgi:hypothetical protein